MFDLLAYLLGQGKATQSKLFPDLDEAALGLPQIIKDGSCTGTACGACSQVCPTNAIKIKNEGSAANITLDLGSCLGCGLCVDTCPEQLFSRNLTTKTAVRRRSDLILSNKSLSNKFLSDTSRSEIQPSPVQAREKRESKEKRPGNFGNIFGKSLAVRVVSTGCAACDAEIGAAGNPIFDMERFGISVVASPRMADALLVTGPVGKGMHEALLSTYQAMAEPRLVIACGTCAISGGVHRGGYAEANGVSDLLPVDIFIPGCPPHPWSIIDGLLLAMKGDTMEPPIAEAIGAQVRPALAAGNSAATEKTASAETITTAETAGASKT